MLEEKKEALAWPEGIIRETEPWKERWDFVVMASIVYMAVVIPYRLAFDVAHGVWFWLEVSIDFFLTHNSK